MPVFFFLLPTLSLAATFTESPLTTLPERLLPDQVTLSPDARHYAYVARRGAQLAVVRDGVEAKPHDWIVGQYLAFTPDSQHLVYQTRDPRGMTTIIDDQPSPLYESVDDFILSPTGARVAFAAKRNRKFHPVIDGKEGLPYDNVRIGALAATGRTACIVSTPAGECVIDNGAPAVDPRGVEESPRLAGPLAGRDGKRGPQAGRLNEIASPINNDKGPPSPSYDLIANLRLSADGQRLAYRARRDNRWLMVLDGKETPAYVSLGPPIFSADGSHLAYIAERDGRKLLILDAREIAIPAGQFQGDPLFSPDGQRLACVLRKDSSQVLIVNGKESQPYDRITTLRFSPDSRRLAFLAHRGDQALLILDNQEHPQPAAPDPRSLTFSPDSKHLAWIARQNEQEVLFIDAHAHRTYDRILPILAWDSPETLRFLAVHEKQTEEIRNEKPTRVRQRTLVRVEAKLGQENPKPE